MYSLVTMSKHGANFARCLLKLHSNIANSSSIISVDVKQSSNNPLHQVILVLPSLNAT